MQAARSKQLHMEGNVWSLFYIMWKDMWVKFNIFHAHEKFPHALPWDLNRCDGRSYVGRVDLVLKGEASVWCVFP